MSDQQEQVTTKKDSKQRGKANRGVLIGAFIVLGVAATGLGLGYVQLARVNNVLASKIDQLNVQLAESKTELTSVEKQVTGLQSSTEKSQELAARQEKMINGWQEAQRGDLSHWYVAEARYLTNLAKYNLQLTKNGALAETLLTQANEVLEKVHNAKVDAIRTSIKANLAEISAQPQVDIGNLYLKLAALDKKIDSLPLPAAPLQPDTSDDQARIKKYEDAPWYKMQWHRTMSAIRKIVIVRYNSGNELPLVLPEEKISLYQNLHAQMEAAMWGALNHNTTIYDTSLVHMIGWIEKYFVQDSEITKDVLQQLKMLQSVNLQPPYVNIAATIQQFDTYLAPENIRQQKVQ